ncbi:hypothetical protein LTS15_002701 [Exophiala xenobiotica]|nr:hypothetical protein LTS15_002701 [Exophiala xenobiotica]
MCQETYVQCINDIQMMRRLKPPVRPMNNAELEMRPLKPSHTWSKVSHPNSQPPLRTTTTASSRNTFSHSVSATSASTSSTTSADASSTTQSSSNLSTGAVAGIAVGSVLGALIVAVAGFTLWWRRRHRRLSQSPDTTTDKTGVQGQDTMPSTNVVEKAELQADYPGAGPGTTSATNKSELATNSNRHELDNTMSANSPWVRSDAELEG